MSSLWQTSNSDAERFLVRSYSSASSSECSDSPCGQLSPIRQDGIIDEAERSITTTTTTTTTMTPTITTTTTKTGPHSSKSSTDTPDRLSNGRTPQKAAVQEDRGTKNRRDHHHCRHHGGITVAYCSSSTEAPYARIVLPVVGSCAGAGARDDDDDDDDTRTASTAVAAAIIKGPFDNCSSSTGASAGSSSVHQHQQQSLPGATNQRLNYHLGLPLTALHFERIRLLTRFLNMLFLSWWDGLILSVLYKIPDSVVRSVIFAAWNVYLPLHRRFLHRSTGLDPSVSFECHALSTVLYPIHFVVTRLSHIRFGLHMLSAVRPAPPRAVVETIKRTVPRRDNRQEDHAVSGRFLHYHNASKMTEYTLVWIYGGAFLSGDAHGNVGTADVLGRSCGMDVWIPDYRKAPCHCMDDILEDISAAYQWIQEERAKAGLDPSKIVLAGWSAGAALCTRLMQSLDRQAMPKAAVLFSPFVQYEKPMPGGSMHNYSLHDWLVTRNIMDVAEQTLAIDTFWKNRNEHYSPLSHSMVGLPPLCVIVSEHEAVYDQTCLLIERACRDQVSVIVGVWRYMAHGWYMLGGLLPEGARALQFAGQFIQAQCIDGDAS